MTKLRTWMLVGVLATFAFAPVAARAAYPPVHNGALSCSSTTVVPSQTIQCTGGGYAANTDVTISFLSVPVVLGTAHTDGSGTFVANVTIPANASLGDHILQAAGNDPGGSILIRTAEITVVGVLSGGLTRTGTNVMPLVWIGIAAVLLGATLTIATRRRRGAAA